MTVIDAICDIKHTDYSRIEQVKEAKIQKKGDFSDKTKVDYIEYDEKDGKFKKSRKISEY